MSRIIIFDFNRTLYDPDSETLISGARELLKECRASGYQLVMIAKEADDRLDLIRSLGLDDLFDNLYLVAKKNLLLFDLVVGEHVHIFEVGQSWVVGDRVQSELWLGHQRGLKTIWVRKGIFANETPFGNTYPTHTITSLEEIYPLIGF
ncbi:MAG: HAD hydrolase-like protein [bacterium]